MSELLLDLIEEQLRDYKEYQLSLERRIMGQNDICESHKKNLRVMYEDLAKTKLSISTLEDDLKTLSLSAKESLAKGQGSMQIIPDAIDYKIHHNFTKEV